MGPETRAVVVAVGLVFCLLFGGFTAVALAEYGLSPFTVASAVVVGLILIGVLGALGSAGKRRR